MPLSRTAEAAWKLTDVRGYELHAEFIQAIKAKSPRLCETYGLCEDYDLADALIGVYHQYLRDKQRLPMARAIAGRERSIQKIYETGSLGQATSGAIVELKVFGRLKSLKEPEDKKSTNALRSAVRNVWKAREKRDAGVDKHKRGGRYPDQGVATVCRTLAFIYYRGTGKLPSSGHGKGGFRGRFMKFAVACLQLLSIEIPLEQVEKYMLVVREHLRRPLRRSGRRKRKGRARNSL